MQSYEHVLSVELELEVVESEAVVSDESLLPVLDDDVVDE